MKFTRRDILFTGAGLAGGAVLSTYLRQENRIADPIAVAASTNQPPSRRNEEYVWLSANANLPLFVGHDHPALRAAARDFGVRVTIAGPDTVDIPGLVAAVEQTAARRPAGMMVVGWDQSALIPAIDKAVDAGIPVVCVDADVPMSKRMAFIGTDWSDIGRRQAKAMIQLLQGRRGKVAMMGLIDQSIDQEAFTAFREVATQAGLSVLEPQHDKGNQAEAARVASGILQAYPDLVGIAGFDSESGPGMGQAIKEAGKRGKVIATCVEAEPRHLQLLREGYLNACVGQKRELFTYQGVRTLMELAHPKMRFTADDKKAGINPVPAVYYTGTFTVTPENADLFATRRIAI